MSTVGPLRFTTSLEHKTEFAEIGLKNKYLDYGSNDRQA